jgi:hypothetical protein
MSNTTQHVRADPDRLEAIGDSASDKGVRHSNDAHDLKSSGPLADPVYRAAVEKRMKRKLDARCSLFVLIYIMNYLDRNNIAAARLRGLQEDLNLSYPQYATCLSILYVGMFSDTFS